MTGSTYSGTLGPFSSKRLCIIDGFDMVGKTTFIKNFMYDFKYYHPNHDITDLVVGRDNSWTIGYGIIDFFSQVGIDNIKAVIDRGPASGYVYKMIYSTTVRITDPIFDVMSMYRDMEFFATGITHIHVCHSSKESAREIYELSQSREVNPNAISAKLDQFSNFEDYWSTYCKAQKLYHRAYDILDISPIIVKTFVGGATIDIDDRLETWRVGTE